jgi:hypothetical protein
MPASMSDAPTDATPAPEPDDPAFLRWLATPEGAAAMTQVMQDTLNGKYGDVPAELRALAAEGLQKREREATVTRVVTAMQALHAAMQQPAEEWPSRWQFVHGLHQQAKDVTDLILDVPEPQRTALMKRMLPLQDMLAKLERETE